MMSLYYRAPDLPWNDDNDNQRFFIIAALFLLLLVAFSAWVLTTTLPERPRHELEKVPPQLARVIEAKKQEPKPAVIEEVKTEPIPEPKVEPKPEPQPAQPEPPKPQPRPQPKPKVEATVEQREQARETAKKAIGNEALSSLQSLRTQVPIAALNTSSKGLSNAGSKATNVGTVVDRGAASRTSGGVDSRSLTTATVGEALSNRSITAVDVTEEQSEAVSSSRARSQEELRLVFEQYKVDYDRIYRMALRKNPALAGSVTLKLNVQPDGSVSSCSIAKSELKDADLHKRLEMKCRQMKFEPRRGVDITTVEFPIRFMP